MAYDKVIDSARLDADLKGVADVIREKTGSSDTIAFPDGFKEAISGIESGSDTSIEDAFVTRSLAEYTNDRVTTIGGYAFRDCSGLTSVSLPNVIRVNTYAFNNCTKLTSLYIPKLQYAGEYMLGSCGLLTEVDFPEMSDINQYAFTGCVRIQMLDFPKYMTIDGYAFNKCRSLKALVMRNQSETVELLSTTAFNHCNHILGTVDSSYNPGGAKDGYFYVPSDLLESYKSATNWSTFADRFRAIEEYSEDGTVGGEMDWNKINGGTV